jgi:hypothetical protein
MFPPVIMTDLLIIRWQGTTTSALALSVTCQFKEHLQLVS